MSITTESRAVKQAAVKAMHNGAFLLAAGEAWNNGWPYSWISTQRLEHKFAAILDAGLVA